MLGLLEKYNLEGVVSVSMETRGVSLPWGQVNSLDVGGNHVWCLVIVVICG